MKQVVCGTLWLPVLCRKLEYLPSPIAQSIACIDGDKFVAGVIFDNFNGQTVQGHIVIEERPSREWFVAIFDYPFNVLNVKKFIAQVNSQNVKSMTICKEFGFEEEARIKEFFTSEADMVILTMRPDQCAILNSELWAPVVKRVRANG